MIVFKPGQEKIADYYRRNSQRQLTLNTATMNLKDYFIAEGDTEEMAITKVCQLSSEVAGVVDVFIMGNTSPLTVAVNNSALEFMTADVKAMVINDLTTY